MPLIFTAITLSYLIGSIPTAYIFGRAVKGIDIRKFGSGNVGATNAFRVLGKGWGITVFMIDLLKGFAPVLFLGNYLIQKGLPVSNELLRIFLGIACVSGHNWTIFLRFKGGKGVAASLGVLVALGFSVSGFKYVILFLILVWFIVFLIFRIVSLASIVASIFLPIFTIICQQQLEIIVLSLVLSIFSIIRHRSNILRLLKGREPAFRKSQ